MRTLSHSTQWWKGPYCLTSLIVEPAHISEPACRGPGLGFFFFAPPPPPHILHPSLFLNFFLFLYFILYPARCLTPLTRTPLHSSSPFSLRSPRSPLPVAATHPLALSLTLPSSLCLSFLVKWWVLTYDRLSQVCFNYCKGDGDGTGEEDESERASEGEDGLVGDKKERKKRTFVHTLYLRSGG